MEILHFCERKSLTDNALREQAPRGRDAAGVRQGLADGSLAVCIEDGADGRPPPLE